MREIKFRGRHNGGWKIGYLSFDFKRDEHLITNSLGDWPVIPETVGQYTGLKDKNGKEIYEGDILKCRVADGVVDEIFQEPKYRYKYSRIEWWQSSCNHGYRLRDGNGKCMMIKSSALCAMKAEVIGNIHENPELEE